MEEDLFREAYKTNPFWQAQEIDRLFEQERRREQEEEEFELTKNIYFCRVSSS